MENSNIISTIYDKVNSVLGGGEQLFCMQFPAQPLNKNMYTYDTSDRNSVVTKPYVISEAEFRLSDQLFDLSPITAGSNGEKLSINYNILINNLIPKLDYLAPFMKDRASLGKWLLEPSGEKDDQSEELSRIELCKKLYLEYLTAKNQWNELKEEKFQSFKTKNDLDGYAKWQGSFGAVELEKLNNLYNDVVVTGHLHEVLTILGYLNASSVSEELELAKQRMRNSARLSLDESMTIYPVQFSPNNWFKALTPNINPKDLTMATDSIRDVYIDKRKELQYAKAELQKLESLSSSDEEIFKIERSITDMKAEIDLAEQKLISTYGDNIFELGKLALKVYAAPGLLTVDALLSLGGDPDQLEGVKKVHESLDKISSTQSNLTRSMSSLVSLKSKKSQLESKDYALNIISLKNRIEELEIDIRYYSDLMANTMINKINNINEINKNSSIIEHDSRNNSFVFIENPDNDEDSLLKITYKEKRNSKKILDHTATLEDLIQINILKKTEGENSENKYSLFDPNYILEKVEIISELSSQPALVDEIAPEDPELQGLFNDVLIKIDKSSSNNSNHDSASSTADSLASSSWFHSRKSESSTTKSQSSVQSSFLNEGMEIGFRVAKVSFDRGGWFNPQFFKMTGAFTKLSDIKLSNGYTKSDILNNSYDNETKCLLPAFPIAMVIAKDITIKIKKSATSSATINQNFEQERSDSGSFLCFSAARSSSSKDSSKLSMTGSDNQYFYIKIPGPQILGYYLQMVPEDKFEEYKPILDREGHNEILDALKAFNVDI